MDVRWTFSYLLSDKFLLSKSILIVSLIIHIAGTIYGYIWYGNQLQFTLESTPHLLLFVPDSPTASLFFTMLLLFWLLVGRSTNQYFIVGVVGALAFITSFKYGIWATVMIFAGNFQGSDWVWQDWMLIVSHLAMAVEVIAYFRFMHIGSIAIILAGVWTLLNDWIDYTFQVFPWLPSLLMDDLLEVQTFTVSLSLLSIGLAVFLNKLAPSRQS